MKPRLLDLFCGAGGATKGYQQGGFYVVGVDNRPQPNYCGDEFYEADALKWAEFGDFVAVHASPPCQAHTGASNRWRGSGGQADRHIDLIPATRRLLEETRLPYVIENVPGARNSLNDPVVLTGEMFGLGVHRPRLFETNRLILVQPKPPTQTASVGVYGKSHDGRLLWRRKNGSEQHAAASLEQAREAMGIDWMEWRELAEAIPPAYTELIGHQLMQHLRVAA